MSQTSTSAAAVTVERDGHVLLMGLNRPDKRNAFNLAMIDQLAAAYRELENDDELRCGVLFAHGDHFTADEVELHQEHRWWTAGEIAASSELFAPRRLGSLVSQLLAQGPPPAPVDVGP